jgi:hypothetical protein
MQLGQIQQQIAYIRVWGALFVQQDGKGKIGEGKGLPGGSSSLAKDPTKT